MSLLSIAGLSKSYGGVAALRDASFDVEAGEVHALIGENGAGKSTLIKILAGAVRADAGRIAIDGAPVSISGARDAYRLGLRFLHQELSVLPRLSVAENLFLGRAYPTRLLGLIDWRTLHERARAVLASFGVANIGPAAILGRLPIADQIIVKIASTFVEDASSRGRLFVMDEPTAALSLEEVKRLFQVVERLRAKGVAVMFVSHRLEEVFAISQRITVMRDGRVVGSGPIGQWTTDEVIRKMVGRSLDALYPKEKVEPGKVVLRVRDLRRAGVFRDIRFEVRQGEIVALAGLVGAGRSEVARAIFGIDALDGGEVLLDGVALRNHTPEEAMAAGISLVPEDRQQQGLVMEMTATRNVTLTVLKQVRRFGIVSRKKERQIAGHWTQRMRLKGHIEEPVNVLSGGNQQKVVLAKWLATKPKLLIVDEPTRGVDVGAKAEVHRTLSQLANEGMAIIMISSELPEVIGMADRVLVMHEGKLTAELSRSEATEEVIMFAATGQTLSKSGGQRNHESP